MTLFLVQADDVTVHVTLPASEVVMLTKAVEIVFDVHVAIIHLICTRCSALHLRGKPLGLPFSP
jgi:hypothetical protein